MNEITLSNVSDRALYHNIGQIIESLGGQIVSSMGYEQLQHPIDQTYIDYELNNKRLTLHLEHYLGISIYSDSIELGELEALAQSILAILH